MAVCESCGAELKEGASFCENCGAAVHSTAVAQQEAAQQSNETVVNTPEQNGAVNGALAFSIVGLVLASGGLLGIIFSAIARKKVKALMAEGVTGGKIKAANILSRIGLILSIVMTVFWVVYAIIMVVMVGAFAYGASNGAFDEIIKQIPNSNY